METDSPLTSTVLDHIFDMVSNHGMEGIVGIKPITRRPDSGKEGLVVTYSTEVIKQALNHPTTLARIDEVNNDDSRRVAGFCWGDWENTIAIYKDGYIEPDTMKRIFAPNTIPEHAEIDGSLPIVELLKLKYPEVDQFLFSRDSFRELLDHPDQIQKLLGRKRKSKKNYNGDVHTVRLCEEGLITPDNIRLLYPTEMLVRLKKEADQATGLDKESNAKRELFQRFKALINYETGLLIFEQDDFIAKQPTTLPAAPEALPASTYTGGYELAIRKG